MIPTMIAFGLLLGRWWWQTLVAAALVWPALLVATGVVGFSPVLAGAALLGAANAAVGALVHQAVLQVHRRVTADRDA